MKHMPTNVALTMIGLMASACDIRCFINECAVKSFTIG